jgi:hypothetical protein
MCSPLLSRAAVASLVALAGLSLECGESPSSPTPVSSAPAPLTLPGVTLRTLDPMSGPTAGGDFLRLFGGGFQTGATVTLGGVAAQVMKVTGTIIDIRTPEHSAGTVDVIVTNPGGERAVLSDSYIFGVFTVTASPSLVAPGASLTMSWTMPPGRNCNGGGDWIAIYKVGDPDETGAANGHSDLWYDHVCGATSGTRTLSAPVQPGEYEFRFMLGDTSFARSNRVTVREPTS